MTSTPFIYLVEQERAARAAAYANGKPTADGLRAWWKAVEAVLSQHVATPSHLAQPFPGDLAHILASLAGDLAVGRVPPIASGVVLRGVTAPTREEAQDIAWAVAYRLACKPDGFIPRPGDDPVRIKDKAPTRRLQAWFGVTARAIQGWVSDNQIPKLPRGPVDARILIRRTKMAGKRYSRLGRGVGALTARAKRTD